MRSFLFNSFILKQTNGNRKSSPSSFSWCLHNAIFWISLREMLVEIFRLYWLQIHSLKLRDFILDKNKIIYLAIYPLQSWCRNKLLINTTNWKKTYLHQFWGVFNGWTWFPFFCNWATWNRWSVKNELEEIWKRNETKVEQNARYAPGCFPPSIG